MLTIFKITIYGIERFHPTLHVKRPCTKTEDAREESYWSMATDDYNACLNYLKSNYSCMYKKSFKISGMYPHDKNADKLNFVT